MTKHKGHQYNTRKIRKGGEYLGKGAFGIVYGGPRLPCKNETYEEIKDKNEVSKIFKTNLDANNEWTSIENLQKIMNENDYNNLQKHVIIPYKNCEIDLKEVGNSTNVFKTNSWMMSKYGKFNENIFNIKVTFNLDDKQQEGTIIRFRNREKQQFFDIKYETLHESGPPTDEIIENVPISYITNTSIHTLPDGYEYKDMIISERGGNSLYNVFFNIRGNTNRFIDAVINLQSILKGIQILQHNNFIHGDIKSANCIQHASTYKLIDMAEVIHIPLIENVGPKPFAFGYSPWPSIIIYSIFFDNRDEINHNINIKLTPADLQYLYKNGHNNDKDYRDYLFRSIIAPFLINSKNGFSTEQMDKIFTICKRLVSQKTCGIINLDIEDFSKPDEYDDMWNNNIFEIMKAKIYNTDYDNKNAQDPVNFLNYFNNIYKNMERESDDNTRIDKHDIVTFKIKDATNNQITNRGNIWKINENNTYNILYYPNANPLSNIIRNADPIKYSIKKINRDELKLDLFKRIDNYSFGIMVLEVIYNYINENDDIMDESLRTMIVQLYDFVSDCCIQTEKCADIDALVGRYAKIITDYDTKKGSAVKTGSILPSSTTTTKRSRNIIQKVSTPTIHDANRFLPPIK